MDKLEPLFQKGRFPEALRALKSGAILLKDAEPVLNKIQTDILLSSKTASSNKVL